jgi:protein-tyrosine phosphatase
VAIPNWIELDGAHNVRDLGGLAAADGVTRPGVLMRSDALDALTETDVRRLVSEVGLAHVIDLRSRTERFERGRGLLGNTAVTYSELEVIDDTDVERRREVRASGYASGEDPESIMALGYAELLDLGRTAFVGVLERLVAPGGTPALVHCAAGKDRTGVLVALLLDVAGVDRDTIVADYAATQSRMEAIVQRLRSAVAYQDMADQVPAFVFEARAGTMQRLLTHLDTQWGGAAGYFEANGADAELLDRWRSLFVEHR